MKSNKFIKEWKDWRKIKIYQTCFKQSIKRHIRRKTRSMTKSDVHIQEKIAKAEKTRKNDE